MVAEKICDKYVVYLSIRLGIITEIDMNHRINKHIEQQLALNHCAILPTLGGFFLDPQPACYDADKRLAFPPQVSIYFNQGLTHSDALMVESYVRLYGVSYRRAHVMLDEDVHRLRQELVRQRYYNIEGVGRLEVDVEGRITFSSQPSMRLNSQSYGLDVAVVPNVLQTVSETTTHGSTHIQLNISKRMLRYVAMLILPLIGVLYLGNSKTGLTDIKAYQASVAPTSEVIKKVSEVIRPTTEQEEERRQEVVSSVVADAQVGHYYVIVATERQELRARKHFDRLNEQAGHPELRILKGKSVYRVSVASFVSAQEAYEYIGQISSTYPEAWVYKHR